VLSLAHYSHFFLFENIGACMISVCSHNLVTYAQRLQDLYSACLTFFFFFFCDPWAWCSECVHTLDLGLSSHPKAPIHERHSCELRHV
jgi:hypothetical protein